MAYSMYVYERLEGLKMRRLVLYTIVEMAVIILLISCTVASNSTTSNSINNTNMNTTIITPMLSSSENIKTEAPRPFPTIDEKNNLFQNKIYPGYKIGNYVISDDNYIYFQKNNDIYQIKRDSGKEEMLIKTNLKIMHIFLDKNGSLYFHGLEKDKDSGPVYIFENKQTKLIINNVTDLFRIDDEFIYYRSNNAALNKYSIINGNCEQIMVPGVTYDSVMNIVQIEPLLFVYTNKGYGLMDLRTYKVYDIDNYRQDSAYTTDDGSCFICENDVGWIQNELVFYDFRMEISSR